MIIVNDNYGSIYNFDNILSIEPSHNNKYYTLNICNHDLTLIKPIAKFTHEKDLNDCIDKIIDYYTGNKKVVFIKDKLEDKNDTNRT